VVCSVPLPKSSGPSFSPLGFLLRCVCVLISVLILFFPRRAGHGFYFANPPYFFEGFSFFPLLDKNMKLFIVLPSQYFPNIPQCSPPWQQDTLSVSPIIVRRWIRSQCAPPVRIRGVFFFFYGCEWPLPSFVPVGPIKFFFALAAATSFFVGSLVVSLKSSRSKCPDFPLWTTKVDFHHFCSMSS